MPDDTAPVPAPPREPTGRYRAARRAPEPPPPADKPPAPPKSTAQVVSEGLVDLTAILVMGALAHSNREHVLPCLLLIAVLAGSRASDVLRVLGGKGPNP